MLPGNHHIGDTKWIKEQLSILAPSLRKRASMRYGEVYGQGYTNAKGSHVKEGEARREANTRLREFVERCGKLDRVRKPPLSD